MESFGLSRGDAQHNNEWRLRMRGKPANLSLPGKWQLKRSACARVHAATVTSNETELLQDIKK